MLRLKFSISASIVRILISGNEGQKKSQQSVRRRAEKLKKRGLTFSIFATWTSSGTLVA